ncbi:unnamed protein product [Periconia digitata]|uniref:Uncharacterized protein n=1 Tax=Periconia digitata TaxID=1303443 RepID=A0A9W4URU9_9PLEO|nr:unnamed protein product [Periconia digitata]
MAARPFFAKSAFSRSIMLKGLLLLLLNLLPPVLGNCSVETVTETTWVTVSGPTVDMPPTPSSQPVASPEPAHTSSSVGISGGPAQTTNIDKPSSSGNGGMPSATYNPLPKPAAAIHEAPPNFNRLIPLPNTGSIRNSCGYDVYVWSVGCTNSATNVKINAGSTWTEPLRRCNNGGVVYKVSKKEGDDRAVMQFEAGLYPDQDMVQYDLSYLNCMVPQTTDLSACAGWEGGHQAVSGKGCQVFVCNPGEYCDGSSYTVAEFGNQFGGLVHPNAGCASTYGVAFELCACSKA